MNLELFKSSHPLPEIPITSTKKDVIELLKDYASSNNFELVIARSTKTAFHLKCKKGGTYRNCRKLAENDRKCWKNTNRTECPFYVRVGTNKSGNLTYLSSTDDNEHFHNHEITVENILSTSTGRKKLLTSDDIEILQRGIEQNTPTKSIQNVLSKENDYNKLTVHDINNLKYSMTNRVDIKSSDGASNLIAYMKSHGFIVECKTNPVTAKLDGLFFTNPVLLERTQRFPEVVLIDATYNTNDLKMPLISAFGVGNIGKETLKTFPIAFAWVTSENEDMYEWYLRVLNENVGSVYLKNTVFITDKCKALINQLDEQYADNDKLLCIWHMMQNMSKHATLKIFSNSSLTKSVKNKVFAMINCNDADTYLDHRENLYEILSESSNFVNKKAQESFVKYYNDEWEEYLERWAGHITSKYKHFGCTTTQRAESGHAIFKKGVFTLHPLDLAFDNICTNLLTFERGYNDALRKEKNEVDVLVSREPRLKSLIGKVTHFCLVSLRCELLRDMSDIFDECNCKTLLSYGIPCCHQLYDLRSIESANVPKRWWLENPVKINYDEDVFVDKDDCNIDDNENTEHMNLIKEPWMKYISKIETVFRSFNYDHKKTMNLMSALDKVLRSFESEESTSKEENLLDLPKVKDVKSPGRPKKIQRLSALKKDYVKGTAYRKNLMVFGKRIALKIFEEKQEKADKSTDEYSDEEDEKKTKKNLQKTISIDDSLEEVDKKFDTFDFDVEEVLEMVTIPDKTTKKSLYINNKRKPSQKAFDNDSEKKKKLNNDNNSRSSNIQDLFSKLHPSIDVDNVGELYDPAGDGNCGYRSIAFLHYGDENRYKDVKRDMLKTFELNKAVYEKNFCFNLKNLEKNITSALDENTAPIWFKTPHYAQVAADTYGIPICVYSDPASTTAPETCLPIAMPVKPKLKIQPYCIQNFSNIHWFAIKFRHLQMKYPTVHYFYFNLNDSYAKLYKTTWNLFGQFPKYKESRSFDPKKDELLEIQSSEEE